MIPDIGSSRSTDTEARYPSGTFSELQPVQLKVYSFMYVTINQ
jgi:hypothetical protein